MEIGLFLLLGAAAIVAVTWFGHVAKQRRREGFARMAMQLGLEYSAEDPFGTLSEPFAFFEKGDGRGVENVLSGTWQGVGVRLFDYWYFERSTDGNGHSSRTYYRFDCVIVPLEADCPRLMISHENVGTWLANALTFHDIRFESDAFNREYYVKCSDNKFANDLVDARMIEWLMKRGDGFSFEVAGNEALCYQKKVEPIDVVPLLGTTKAFLDHIPRVVYSLYPR